MKELSDINRGMAGNAHFVLPGVTIAPLNVEFHLAGAAAEEGPHVLDTVHGDDEVKYAALQLAKEYYHVP